MLPQGFMRHEVSIYSYTQYSSMSLTSMDVERDRLQDDMR